MPTLNRSWCHASTAALCWCIGHFTGADQAFIDIAALLRLVYGQATQGASYGLTKSATKRAAIID